MGCFALKSIWLLPILNLATINPSSSRKGENCMILLPFGISFSASRDFISSPNCSCCSSLKIVAFAFSLSPMLTTSVAGLCLFNDRCTYGTVFTSLLKLLNRSHWITAFFSSVFIMKTDEVIFSSSEAKNRFTCSGHSLSDRCNQAGQMSRSLLLSSSMLIALLLMPAVLLIPLTYLHCETSVVSSISSTRSATNTCCLWGELYIHCKTVVESDQNWNCLSSFHVLWLSALSTDCHDIAIPIGVLKEASSVLLCIFQWQTLSQLSTLLAVNVDKPLHRSCPQMRPQTREVRFYLSLSLSLSVEVPSIDACFSYNWKMLFSFQDFCFVTRKAPLRCPNVVHS